MRGERAVVRPEVPQPPLQHLKVPALVLGQDGEVMKELPGQALRRTEARNGVPGQVDRPALDVCEAV